MWLAMTAAMMAPVVFPWLRALSRVGAGVAGPRAGPVSGPVAPFLVGYWAAWIGFGLAAAALQWTLAGFGLPVPFGLGAPGASALVLLLAGCFQFTPLKRACLAHCRSPVGYLLSHWRVGFAGRARMGLGHGLHCLGCCWALMLLALAVGMVHLGWMALLTGVMVAETSWRGGGRLTRPLGVALIAAAAAVGILG